MLTLEGIRYSPWTEKARWALDHHEIPYQYREHLILVGMPALRLRMRKLTGDITVPVLFLEKGGWIMDSLKIAEWADEQGRFAKLFWGDKLDEIRRWNERTEDATDAARALVLYKMATDRESQEASLPRFIPAPFRGAARSVTRLGMKYISGSFNSRARTADEHRVRLVRFADEVRAALKSNYLLGERFCYADIAVAATLSAIRPVGEKHLRLPEAIRRVWTEPELAERYQDLLHWRDRVYSLHRKKRISPG